MKSPKSLTTFCLGSQERLHGRCCKEEVTKGMYLHTCAEFPLKESGKTGHKNIFICISLEPNGCQRLHMFALVETRVRALILHFPSFLCNINTSSYVLSDLLQSTKVFLKGSKH